MGKRGSRKMRISAAQIVPSELLSARICRREAAAQRRRIPERRSGGFGKRKSFGLDGRGSQEIVAVLNRRCNGARLAEFFHCATGELAHAIAPDLPNFKQVSQTADVFPRWVFRSGTWTW